MNPPLPFNEKLRLEDLYAYEILDSESEPEFNDLLEVAARICGCPMAAITFIDRERQWLKATVGLDPLVRETSREVSFCSHTILQPEVMVVDDARTDERFRSNPFVTGEPGIRFYAGAPIISRDGFRLGAVCVVDQQPRTLAPEEMRTLQVIARQISQLLELRLKNKMLQQKAAEQIALEKLMVRHLLQEQEQERQHISNELHENIAQTMASAKFFLELAEETTEGRESLLRRSRELVSETLRQIRELSFTITPTTLNEFNLRDLVHRLLSHLHNRDGAVLTYRYEGRETVDAETAMAVYRILEDQLKRGFDASVMRGMRVRIYCGNVLHLSVIAERAAPLTALSQSTLQNRIAARVETLGGSWHHSGDDRRSEWTITLPLGEAVATPYKELIA